jgi:hypothetical protein
VAIFGTAVVGFALLFFMVAFVQFAREAMRSRKKPKHLIRMAAERPTAKIFTLREPPALPKAILVGKKANGVAAVSPSGATTRRGAVKGS